MRALAASIALAVAASSAAAEPLPPGSLGLIVGAASGTGADAKTLGFGYLLGGQAAWQPMNTESRLGWSVKWSALFGTMYAADAARIDSNLLTLQLDLLFGVRIRAGESASRYVTLRAGGLLLRANQEIPPEMFRAFAGAIASVGLDQYISGWLFNVDLRYSMIGDRPAALGIVLGVSKTGP